MKQNDIEPRSVSVAAPYALPEGWKWTRLGEVVNIYNGDRGENYPNKKDYVSSGIPFINAGCLENGNINYNLANCITEEKYNSLRAGKILKEDILYCLRGSLGKLGIVREERYGAISSSLCIFRSTENIVPDFLLNVLKSNIIFQQQKKIENGTAQPNLSAKEVAKYIIPLPPTLDEQKRIVSRIESLFTKLDEARDKAQSVVDGFELRRAAILHKAFTGELTANWRKENGVKDESWEEKTIGECFTHTTGKALKKDNQNGTPREYITTSNLYWDRFDFSEVRTMYFTDEELEKCTAKKGDLLLCNGGDVGRAAIWNFDYDICLQNHVSKLRNKGNVETRLFLYYFMLSKIKGNVNGKGIGISSLSAKDLLSMQINLPTLPEQQEIVRILDSVLEKEADAKETAERVLEQIDLLKKSILARAFRGEL